MSETSPQTPTLAPPELTEARLKDERAPAWLLALRRAGLDVFTERGLPTPKVEAWKYTRLNALQKIAFTPVEAAAPPSVEALPESLPRLKDAWRAVYVNGIFRPDLSSLDGLPEGVFVGGLAGLLEQAPQTAQTLLGRVLDIAAMPLAGLNAVLADDGPAVVVPEGCRLDRPLELTFLTAPGGTPLIVSPRGLIALGRDARARVLENHAGQGDTPYLVNTVMETALDEGAVLDHVKFCDESASGFHIAAQGLSLARAASYDGFLMTLGGRLVRNEMVVRLSGERAECRLNGAYALVGADHADNTVLIDHAAPHTVSRQMVRGVVDDTAHGVFLGKVLVRKAAQHTDAHQIHRALLLSQGGEVDAKPELEIYADDVQCGHGSTTGSLDEDALFYLRARGIGEEEARALLIEAFLTEVVAQVRAEPLRDLVNDRVRLRLAERRRLRAGQQTTPAEERTVNP